MGNLLFYNTGNYRRTECRIWSLLLCLFSDINVNQYAYSYISILFLNEYTGKYIAELNVVLNDTYSFSNMLMFGLYATRITNAFVYSSFLTFLTVLVLVLYSLQCHLYVELL